MIVDVLDEKYVDQQRLIKNEVLSERTIRRLQKPPMRVGQRLLVPIKSFSATIRNRIENLNATKTTRSEPLESDEISTLMEHVLSMKKQHERYSSIYQKYGIPDDRLSVYTKTHALLQHILNQKAEGFKVKLIFLSFRKLTDKHQISFYCSNYNYFTEKLKTAEEQGIETAVVNQNRGELREARKFTEIHKSYARYYYSRPQRFKYKVITQKVNEQAQKRGLYKVSIGTIKRYLSAKDIQNFLKPFRLGKKWAKENIFPFLTRTKPKFCNSQWQIDCTDLPFYIWIPGGEKGVRWVLCLCVDKKSRKVLAWEMLPTENTRLVLTTLFGAICSNYTIPREITHDNGSAFRSERFKMIEERLFRYDCISHPIPVGEPQRNGTVENVNNVLQDDFLCYEEGFLGKNIGSRREGNTVPREVIAAHYSGKVRLTEQVVRGYVSKAITLFNNGEIWREEI